MCRLKSLSIATLVFVLFGVAALAQRRGASSQTQTEIQVRVSYEDERPVEQQLQVDLLNDQGIPLLQTVSDSEGRATFHISGGGVFRARVSGIGIETTLSDAMVVDPNDRMAMTWVHIPRKTEATNTTSGSAAMTTANDLKVPNDARKSFTKGLDAFRHQDYQKAADLFEKAIASYPQYDAAYDNLGVAFMRLKQTDKAREAFEHAVLLNDKNADADRNYARLLMADKEYPKAVDALKKSLMVDPQSASALSMLSIAQFQTHDFDGALQSALKVHDVPHEGYAIAHFVAGRAYEVKGEYPQATAQYETYLKEDPKGAQVQQVQNALARMTASGGTPSHSNATPQ